MYSEPCGRYNAPIFAVWYLRAQTGGFTPVPVLYRTTNLPLLVGYNARSSVPLPLLPAPYTSKNRSGTSKLNMNL